MIVTPVYTRIPGLSAECPVRSVGSVGATMDIGSVCATLAIGSVCATLAIGSFCSTMAIDSVGDTVAGSGKVSDERHVPYGVK